MPKVRRSRKPPPEGWELIEPTLDELDQKMREGNFPFQKCVVFLAFSDLEISAFVFFELILNRLFYLSLPSAETEPHEGKRKTESMWPIFRYLYAMLWIRYISLTVNVISLCFYYFCDLCINNISKFYSTASLIVRDVTTIGLYDERY